MESIRELLIHPGLYCIEGRAWAENVCDAGGLEFLDITIGDNASPEHNNV